MRQHGTFGCAGGAAGKKDDAFIARIAIGRNKGFIFNCAGFKN